MNKINLKKAIYVLLSIAALLLYWRIFSKVSGGNSSNSTKNEIVKTSNLGVLHLIKKNERLGEIINPFFKSITTHKIEKVVKQKNAFVKREKQVETKILPKITYHGTIVGKEVGASAYVIMDGKMYIAKENIELIEGIIVKKIWADSIKIKIYDQNEIFYR